MSRRARYVRLKVTARDGLVVTVPARWRGDIDSALADRAEWIDSALAKVADRRALFLAGPAALLPQAITICGATVPVAYEDGRSRARAHRDGGIITVSGDDPQARLTALQSWVTDEAKWLLPARLEELSARSGMEPANCRVRRVRSRWGSCTAAGDIMLGRDLVFLPPHLIDSVIYHELAHLSRLDHSPHFYAVLERLDPHWKTHRAELRTSARSFVPAWADA